MLLNGGYVTKAIFFERVTVSLWIMDQIKGGTHLLLMGFRKKLIMYNFSRIFFNVYLASSVPGRIYTLECEGHGIAGKLEFP